MKIFRELRPWAYVAGLALIYRATVTMVWAFLPRYNPVTQWLLDTYAGSNSDLYYVLIHIHDSIVNVLLALPFAYLITRIRPDRRWLYAVAVVLAMFVWDYRVVLFERRNFFGFVFGSGRTLAGLVQYVLYLPVSVFCVSVFMSRKNRKLPTV